MKKITSAIIVAAMLLSMMVLMIPTASAAWDGSSVSAALIGSGTEFDPYLISSENDLAFVQKQVNDGITHFEGEYIKLTVDLDLGGHVWHPIGELKANYFGGNFDGDGHTITNLNVETIVDSNAQWGGLFGRGYDCTIKNLNIDGATISSSKYSGVIIGGAYCTAETGGSLIYNCHVSNATLKGLHVGSIVGRTSTKEADKGQIKIVGCSGINVTMGIADTSIYTSASMSNHYVGGIVGAVGATLVDACWVENLTVNAYATGSPLIGGIVGVHGADSVSTDVTNCYAIGVTINVSAECNPSNGSYGGLIGKAAHVAVSFGDPNTEACVYNCFVSGVTINDPTESVNKGVVMGRVNDSIYFNDVYYVPVSGLASFGYDKFFAEWPFAEVTAASEVKAEDLNSGNSTKVWADDVVIGHPVIDVAAALENAPAYVDYYVEHAADTTEEVTTEAPAVTDEVTTEAPVVTDEPTDAPETTDAPTEAPVVTDAPAQGTEAPKEEKGCGGMIAGGVIIVALLGTAVVLKKRD